MPDATVPIDETAAKTRTGYFAELIDLSEAAYDDAANKVRVTLIKPGWSANGRYYSRTVLAKAAPMFEGTKAYFDHPSNADLKNRPERSVRDIAGWYENVTQEADGRIAGDLVVIATEAMPIIKAAITRNPNLAGLSINALGSTRMGEAEGRKGQLVEDIAKANSTDIVTTPAAGGTFERLLASDTDGFTRDLLEAMPLTELQDVLREARPDLITAFKAEWKTVRDTQAMETLRAEADTAKQQASHLTEEKRAAQAALTEALDTITALRKERLVDSLLEDRKLPIKVRQELKTKLMGAADSEAMQAVIETTAAILEAVRLPVRVTGAGNGGNGQPEPAAQPRANPIAEVLGIPSSLASAETIEDFMEARKQLATRSA